MDDPLVLDLDLDVVDGDREFAIVDTVWLDQVWLECPAGVDR